jgi:YD repeat-containing protein
MYLTHQTYDWKGRPLITNNPDLTTKEISYAGCGCAGGEVVTLTDEGTIAAGVPKRRQQRIYSDVFGRPVKTEVLNWQGGSTYATTVNTYNVRDQVTQVRQYAGAETSGSYQDTTMTYDGYGRLKTRHMPQENAGTGTTWSYNLDDSVNTITDARGAVTTFGYAGTNRGLVKTITHTLSGSPQINISYNYDAVGNRTSMNDAAGTVSYGYDQLSRLTSETRTLSGVGSFALSYSYNLAGQLTSLNSFGQAISYTRDTTGRLTAVSGSPFGGVTQYINNIKYRAWGARRELTYGNNHTATTQFNSRQLPTSYSLSNVMTRTYSYFADGRLSTSSLTEDSSFDRAYEYDHAGRLKSDTTPTNFAQELTYDAWGNVTQSIGWHWSQFISAAGTYVNNRNTAWQYNAAGQVTSNGDNAFAYDAAGQISKFWKQGLVPPGSTMLYDGDGQLLRGANSNIYNLRSTVLGGRVVAEVLNTGQRARGFVYAEGEEMLALQYDGTNHVVWEHHDAAEQSVRQAENSGVVVDEREETVSGAKIEKEDPYPTDPSFTGADTDGAYPHIGTVGKPITGCALDGVPLTDCTWFFQQLHPMEMMEWNARSEFLYYSASVDGRSVGAYPDLQTAIASADALGSSTLIRNWGVNDNWFQGSVSSLQGQSQNPRNPTNKGTPMTDAEIAKHRAAVEELLQDKTCKNFVDGVLSQIGDAQRKPFSGNLLTIFDKVTSLNGWGQRAGEDMNFDNGEGGSYVGNTDQTAYINISRKARMYGDSSSTGFVGRVVIHEVLHVGSRAGGQFTHWDMFRAGFSVAQRLGIKLGVRRPTEKDPGGRDDYNADGFDDLLFEACQIRKVRRIR